MLDTDKIANPLLRINFMKYYKYPQNSNILCVQDMAMDYEHWFCKQLFLAAEVCFDLNPTYNPAATPVIAELNAIFVRLSWTQSFIFGDVIILRVK